MPLNRERLRAETLFFEGNRCLQAGDAGRAEACLRQAVELAPDFAEGYGNLGLAVEKRGDSRDAEACYRRSIALNPALAQVHLNLGVLLAGAKRFAEAEAAYRRGLALNPASPSGWSNLGVLYACMLREQDAERCHRTALARDQGHANARFNLAYLLLRQGRFEEGWQCLEARDWYAGLAAKFLFPRWQGEPLAGRRILIGCEAGHGDMIQFCRYAALLKARGAAAVGMICHPALKTLFGMLEALDTVVALDEPIPASGWDFWTPPLSLPCYCGTRLDSIPADIPYLRPPAERVAAWQALLAQAVPRDRPRGRLRVGLVWKGSTGFENDADRSLGSLEVLAPLGAVAGVSFISLQKGAGEDEAARPPEGLALANIGPRLSDFADTAAVLSELDLVISVDTAVAHLAGALGTPCWLLLPAYKTDWRWLTERADSPWYPGVMRLFRQPAMGDWGTVIGAVAAALASWARDAARRTPDGTRAA